MAVAAIWDDGDKPEYREIMGRAYGEGPDALTETELDELTVAYRIVRRFVPDPVEFEGETPVGGKIDFATVAGLMIAELSG